MILKINFKCLDHENLFRQIYVAPIKNITKLNILFRLKNSKYFYFKFISKRN